MKFNTIIIYATNENAEQILKHAEHILRFSWNLYGFKRINSGYQTIMTDGFGNPYGNERLLKLFAIAIEVPECMDYRTVTTYLHEAACHVNCYAEYHFVNLD